MFSQKIIEDLRNQHAKARVETFVPRVMDLVLFHQPIPVFGGESANLDLCHAHRMARLPLAKQALSG